MSRSFILAKLAVAFGLLAYLFYEIDWQQSLSILVRADPVPVVAALVINIVSILVSTMRWQILLRPWDLNISNMQALRSYWIGNFASNFLPTNVGGDVIRVASLHRLKRTAEITASVLVDRVSGLAVLLCICLVVLFIGPPNIYNPCILFLIWAGVLGLTLIVLAVILVPQAVLYPFTLPQVSRFRLAEFVRIKLTKLVNSYRRYRDHKSEILLATAGSLIFYLCLVVSQYYCLEAVGAGITLGEVLLVAPLLPLIGLLPISFNGLGLIEAAFVAFYTAAGAPPAAALAAAVLRRLAASGSSAIGAVFWLADGPARQT